jgi:hypothetical protein
MHPFDEGSELVAGCVVPPGCYVRVDVRSGRRIILERSGPLPASLDGCVAVYERVARLTPELVGAAAGPRSVSAID